MRQVGPWWWCWMATWVAAMAGGARAASPIGYARVQFLPARTPSVYIRMDDDKTVRYAASAQDLARAAPLRPRVQPSARDVRRGVMLEYPEVDLSAPESGLLRVRGRFLVRCDPRLPTLYLRLAVTRPAPGGTPLTYLFEVGQSALPATGSEDESPIVIPDLSAPRLLVQTSAEERSKGLLSRLFPPRDEKVGLAVRLLIDSPGPVMVQARGRSVRVTVGGLEFTDVQVHGESVPVRLEVKDSREKVVRTQSGTLKTFAFT